MERDLIPIRVPVDKDLGGYCVFLIEGNQKRFNSIQSLDDFEKIQIRPRPGWIDVDIFAQQFSRGHCVVLRLSFEMVINKRSTGLRAAWRFLMNTNNVNSMPICTSRRIWFFITRCRCISVSKTDAGRRLAARAEEGMWMMIEDGSYDRIFPSIRITK